MFGKSILITCTALILVLAGCMGVGAESTLKYDGQQNGSHSEASDCDDQGKIKGSGDIRDGSVLITLKDSTGKQLLSQSFSGGVFTFDEKTVSGTSGEWTVTAARSGNDLAGDQFAGDYKFVVNC